MTLFTSFLNFSPSVILRKSPSLKMFGWIVTCQLFNSKVVCYRFIGKSSLVNSYIKNVCLRKPKPTTFENYCINVTIDDRLMNLELWDTAGVSGYEKLQPYYYAKADVFIICFSLVNYASFENVHIKWYPEVRNYCLVTPILLVGTGIELREDDKLVEKLKEKKSTPIAYLQLKNSTLWGIGLMKYLEYSSSTQIGLKIVFEEAIRAALSSSDKKYKGKRCAIL